MSKKQNFFKTKLATIFFAMIALIGGLAFLNQNFTGNAILSENDSGSLLSLIGILLILCAIILALYSVKKK